MRIIAMSVALAACSPAPSAGDVDAAGGGDGNNNPPDPDGGGGSAEDPAWPADEALPAAFDFRRT